MKKTILIICIFLISLNGCATRIQTQGVQETLTPSTSATVISTQIIETPHPTKTITSIPNKLVETPTETTVIPTHTITPIPSPTLTEVAGVIVTDPNNECQKVPTPELTTHPYEGMLFSGIFNLCEQWPIGTEIPNDQALWGFDLDSGQASGIYNSKNDILYFIFINKEEGTPVYWLMPTDNSKMYSINLTNPSYSDCWAKINSGAHEDGSIDANNGIACILTSEGKVAYIRVESINNYGWGSLTAFFIAWDK